eukprot:comp24367_c0_seq1/m.46630 comp24367_c0_seq1/g.46630  ORF comp24367_c0_seq1/g.46630 comp24367_c0_seq1/m.46630 type:complete len:139 (-) comp24367_c0_seq1:274-690(-)
MASGVAVADDVVNKYNDIKLGHKHKYMIMQLNDKFTEIVVTKLADPSATYDDFLKELPAGECRYAVYDFDFELKDGGKRNKLIFFVWAPDDAKIKLKMLTASSKDALRKKLVGISTEIQATGADEIDYKEVLLKAGGD